MKTHDVAKIFKSLAQEGTLNNSLTAVQKTALIEATEFLDRSPNFEFLEARVMRQSDDLAVSLLGLVALSKYNKQQWIKIIEEFNLPIELNPRASTRDVVGKVLGYLESHPEALRKNRKRHAGTSSEPPSTLEDTLNKLINFK